MNIVNDIIDTSTASKRRRTLGDVTLPSSFNLTTFAHTRSLRACQLDLTSLIIGPESSLSSIVQDIATLDASHNQISSLQGIESFIALEVLNLSHNSIHVIDSHSASLLRCLVRLKDVDLSHNRIMLIDLNVSPNDKPKRTLTNNDLAMGTFKITTLNLSHNNLIDLPDLRDMLNLQVLNLSHNSIEDLSGIDGKLPLLTLHTLALSHNRLLSVSDLLGLSALASRLRHLELAGNPFQMMVKPDEPGALALFPWWRPFTLWLLPFTTHLDGALYARWEQKAALGLFRERGVLSKPLLRLMNPGFQRELLGYLWEHAKGYFPLLQGGGGGTIATTSARGSARTGRTKRSLIADSVVPRQSSEGAFRANGAAPLTEIVRAIQHKLRTLSEVVEVLWRHDIARRNHAARTIQRHLRRVLVWRHLSDEERERLQVIRERMARVKWRSYRAPTLRNLHSPNHPQGMTSSGGIPCMSRSSTASLHQNTAVLNLTSKEGDNGDNAHSRNYVAGISEVLDTMRTLQAMMMPMWGDFDELRAMAAREQRRAAITIQRIFRGYRARKSWRELKIGYDTFVDSITPYILLLQRCGRGSLGRAKFAEKNSYRQEVRALSREVLELRQELSEMRMIVESLARQQRLSKYEDPEKAMDEIIGQYARKE
ncbi:unnamed protein product [Phytomonas sp. Hart1]|nr:unnamed protein product [Phytomonas sp. Hart1]|eukprot:CCW68579.1 unnamed protein product [Phytomonas sp. isolate Hart1]